MALLNYTVDKWEFVGPPYYAPQVRSSLQRKLFFTICRRQILHHAQRAFFTTASAVPSPKYRERSEPNSEPPYGGGSVIARRVSAGYPGGEILEPRVRGGRKLWVGV